MEGKSLEVQANPLTPKHRGPLGATIQFMRAYQRFLYVKCHPGMPLVSRTGTCSTPEARRYGVIRDALGKIHMKVQKGGERRFRGAF